MTRAIPVIVGTLTFFRSAHGQTGEQALQKRVFYRNVSTLFGLCKPCDGFTVLSENYGTFIKPLVNQRGWTTYYDQASKVPYMLRTDGSPGYITYDDAFSTYYRITYSLWQRQLGGAFLWSLDADYDGHSQDLLDAMYQAALRGPSTQPQ